MRSFGIFLLSVILASSSSAQEKINFDFKVVRLKYGPTQTFRQDLSYRLDLPDKSNRLKQETLDRLRPVFDLDLKNNRKTPDVIISLNVQGITIREMKTLNEAGVFFKEIIYTVSSKIDFIKSSDNSLVKSILLDDGTATHAIKMGSNFFVQRSLENSKYPKPPGIPDNNDILFSDSPELDKETGKRKITGFATIEGLHDFVKNYGPFIEAKAEALAFEAEFVRAADVLTGLFGTLQYRSYLGPGMITKKSRKHDYDDFDKANADFLAAMALMKDNMADSNAMQLLQDALKFFRGIENSGDPRMEESAARSVVYYNISLLSALAGDIGSADKYFALYKAREKTPDFTGYLADVIKIKRAKVPADTPAILAGL